MKNIIATFILLLSQPVFSEELIRVKNNDCFEDACLEYHALYHEWKLKSDENIRLVIGGHEDSFECKFYRVNKDGTRSVILDVYPIIIDSEGNHWWGYAWDVLDIPIEYKDGKVFVQATFEHDHFRSENSDHPKWQQRIPVVKFYGKKTRWNFKQPKYNYESLSLEALAELSQPFVSEELVLVENIRNGFYKHAHLYYEWKLKSDENIRIVKGDYGNGFNCRFYRVNEAGTYSVILDVLPIITDSEGNHWRGIPGIF